MPNFKSPKSPRRSEDRGANVFSKRKRFLIFCEGLATEPNYFESIINDNRLSNVVLDDGRSLDFSVDGGKKNTLTLVKSAEERQRSSSDKYDEIWCVFDKDDFKDDSFDNAIHKTQGHAVLRAAWSNESFELWYLLHFFYVDTSPARKQNKNNITTRKYYIEMLDKQIKQLGVEKYDKGKTPMYSLLGRNRLRTAIINAEKLLANYEDRIPYHDRKPATTVHHLVCKLLSHLPEYSDLVSLCNFE